MAIVTNDKAHELVDTLNLRGQGLNVGELPGVCFCGNVEELVRMVDVLALTGRPDVVIAEPVGSCLDMTATVIRPLQKAFGRRFDIAPYGVLVKPLHAAKILRGEENAGVSPKAAYIFLTQLAEADFAVINRIDQLTAAEVDELRRLLAARWPGLPISAMSARTGVGFEAFAEQLERTGNFRGCGVSIDYEAYAAGEAELAWLNASLLIAVRCLTPLNDFVVDFLASMRRCLEQGGVRAAHVKATALAEGRHAAANLIDTWVPPEVSFSCDDAAQRVQLVVNARVRCEPRRLREIFLAALDDAPAMAGGSRELIAIECFAPGSPDRDAGRGSAGILSIDP